MITHDLNAYLKTDATLSGLLGGTTKIYRIQAPTTGTNPPTMPWVVTEVTSGPRTKISQTKMEEIAYARITVDAGPGQENAGANIVERCLRLIENYRGIMTTANDVHISVGAIRGWAGFGGVFRYQFDAVIRFTETYTQP